MPPSEPLYMSRPPLSPLSLSSLSLSVPVGGSLVLRISISIPNKPVLHKQVQHGQAPRPARQAEEEVPGLEGRAAWGGCFRYMAVMSVRSARRRVRGSCGGVGGKRRRRGGCCGYGRGSDSEVDVLG